MRTERLRRLRKKSKKKTSVEKQKIWKERKIARIGGGICSKSLTSAKVNLYLSEGGTAPLTIGQMKSNNLTYSPEGMIE